MTVALAASAAFMTPISSPVNTLVLGPGRYRFGDFMKIGVPFTLLVMALTVRSEEHTSELQSRPHLPSFPTRRSSDLAGGVVPGLATGLFALPVRHDRRAGCLGRLHDADLVAGEHPGAGPGPLSLRRLHEDRRTVHPAGDGADGEIGRAHV